MRRKAQVVRVKWRKARGVFVLWWRDPATGKPREEQTETTRRRDAYRLAADKEADLSAHKPVDRVAWFDFRKRVEAEKFGLQSAGHLAHWKTVANSLEASVDLTSLYQVDASVVSRWLGTLSTGKLAKSTIASYLNTLMAGLRWAATIYPDYEPPRVKRVQPPKRRAARGRPLTGEEFDRLLKAAKPVVGERYAQGWRALLRGLYLGGLRLGEALSLSWDNPELMRVADLDGRTPKLIIWAETEKGREDRAYPITPDFAAFLRRCPADKRHGSVFRPRTPRGRCRRVDSASKIIARIGKRAKIVVDRRGGAPQYATAHDLRRSFGNRWAPDLREMDLMQLMRHESIETTRKYYLDQNADALSARLREVDRKRSQGPNGGQSGGAPKQPPQKTEKRET